MDDPFDLKEVNGLTLITAILLLGMTRVLTYTEFRESFLILRKGPRKMEHLHFNEGVGFDTVLQGVGSVVVCNFRFLFCSAFIRFLASLGAIVSTPK
jgi:hypothetical protein